MKNWLEILKGKSSEEAIGEIIASDHMSFRFQTYGTQRMPNYASFVAALAGDEIDIGVVVAMSIEPNVGVIDRPKMFRMKREELYNVYKDIMDKFSAICEAITIAYYTEEGFIQSRPRRIPLIHDLVFIPEREMIRDLHLENDELNLRYLPILYNTLPRDERALFSFFMESFFDNLLNYFNEEEIQALLKPIQASLTENHLDTIIDDINNVLARWLTRRRSLRL